MAELTAPVIKQDDEKRIVYGPVLVPDEPDSDDDRVTAEQIEKVAHTFVEDYGNIDLQHSLNNVGGLVESYIAPSDMDFGDDVIVPKGSWMMGVRVTNEDAWQSVKSGKLTGFSIMGISQAAQKSTKNSAEKRTTLQDLGNDFIVNAVSLVDEPAVPKAKWIAVKSKGKYNQQEITQETIQKAIDGSIEQRQQLVRRAVYTAFDGDETDSHVYSTNEDSVVVRVEDFARGNSKMVKIDYEINNDGAVNFTGEPQEVKIEENIVPIENENNDPMNVFQSKSKDGFMDKVRKFFVGENPNRVFGNLSAVEGSEKAGRKISDANYSKLQSAKEVIDNLLEMGDNERSEKNKGANDMNEQEVKELVKSEMKPVNEKVDEVLNTLKAETQGEGTEGQADKSQGTEGDQQDKQQAQKSDESEGITEQQFNEVLKSMKENKPFSKRLSGQDDLDSADKEKADNKPKRDAFGRKIKK